MGFSRRMKTTEKIEVPDGAKKEAKLFQTIVFPDVLWRRKYLPPMVVYKSKHVCENWKKDGPKGTN